MSGLTILSDDDKATATANGERRPALTLEAVREKLAGSEGPRYWRSLEELAATPEFEEMVHREFPRQASQWAGGEVDRRRFLQLMSASLALGGLAACKTQPPEKIVPYVDMPEGLVPGEPWTFATTRTLNGYGSGLLVESHMGRPTKVEGNPEHPASRGATDVFAQASVLDLYDPDRVQSVQRLRRATTWDRFSREIQGVLNAQGALRGAGLRLLTGAVSSPSLRAEIDTFLQTYPEARWHVWEPAAAHGSRQGTREVFGAAREPVYDLGAADVVLALDSDLLTTGPGAVAYARQFTGRRRDGVTGEGTMIRLYSVESTPTSTGTLADHRLALAPSEIAVFVRALAAELGVEGGGGAAAPDAPKAARWVTEVAADLRAAGAAALVVPGDYAPAEIHALAHRVNRALGAEGTTVRYDDPVTADEFSAAAPIDALVADLDAGAVDALVIFGTNPVFTAPADLGFAAAVEKAKLRIYLATEDDETADYCQWLLPEKHYLEQWGDAVAWDGTPSLVQPLIVPLYDAARSPLELMATLNGRTGLGDRELLREYWSGHGLEAEDAWRKALHDGVIARDTVAAAVTAAATGEAAEAAETAGAAAAAGAAGAEGVEAPDGSAASDPAPAEAAPAESDGEATATLELNFRPDPSLWDGRFNNNGWLQELPKPLTKLTWDNALLIAPAAAERLGLSSNDLVELEWRGRTLQVPVWVMPGHADRCATLHLGYGRRRTGRVGSGTGFDAYAIRSSDALWTAPAVRLRRMPGRYELACTQDHHSMEGRHLVRSGSIGHYREEPDFAQHVGHHVPDVSMFPPYEYEGYSWGMAVDLSACTGCNACVVACQSENNIPVVGKEQVLRAREMHWLRIDRYYEGSLDDPQLHSQPVMCQHCEMAPCEVVCPVAATVHGDEGTNDMVYNRCVGTRYCSNNCPYKVRRFNFLQWVDEDTEVLKAVRNPDVTVRTRGVMEKCTYCIQRVNKARQTAKTEGRSIRDGEAATACQQSCPSDAIVFGDLNDADSRVSRWKALPQNYTILEVLNTKPRTSYLAKITNPNPALES